MKKQPNYGVICKFPAPPKGDTWHNPEKLLPTDVKTGYRLLTTKEFAIASKISFEQLNALRIQTLLGSGVWSAPGRLGLQYTYRVPAQTPIIEAPKLKFIDGKYYGYNGVYRTMIVNTSSNQFRLAANPCSCMTWSLGEMTFDELKMLATKNDHNIVQFDTLAQLAEWLTQQTKK